MSNKSSPRDSDVTSSKSEDKVEEEKKKSPRSASGVSEDNDTERESGGDINNASSGGNEAKQSEPKVDLSNPDQPIRIININKQGTKFELDKEALEVVLERAAAINPDKVSVVSVVGAFRTGKSFLLDLLLRYLRHKEQREAKSDDGSEGDDENDDEKNGDFEWLRFGGSNAVEGLVAEGTEAQSSQPGFSWRGGSDRLTTGIWMYGRPFAVRVPATGEKIGLILMDTQGMFDMQTSKELTASIFGLSTLISSYQVYNVKHQIQEDKLEQLDYFTQFSQVALREFAKSRERGEKQSKPKSADDERETDREFHPFQTVEFLVRDWQNFDDEDDLDRCVADMDAVLDKAMNATIADNGMREALRSAFERISCFLLPHPGSKVTKKSYTGSIDDIDPSFRRLLNLYAHRVIDEQIVPKIIQDRAVSPAGLSRYINAYAQVFRDGHMPKHMTLAQAMSETTNLNAREEALTLYEGKMNSLCSGDGAVDTEKLQKHNQEFQQEALALFDGQATFGEDAQIASARKLLIEKMAKQFEQVERNNNLKLRGILVKYIPIVVAALCAFAIDIISTNTCAPWVSVCQLTSSYSRVLWALVLLVIAVELYRIYKSSGSFAASSSAMALLTASLRKLEQLQAMVKQKVKHIKPSPDQVSAQKKND